MHSYVASIGLEGVAQYLIHDLVREHFLDSFGKRGVTVQRGALYYHEVKLSEDFGLAAVVVINKEGLVNVTQVYPLLNLGGYEEVKGLLCEGMDDNSFFFVTMSNVKYKPLRINIANGLPNRDYILSHTREYEMLNVMTAGFLLSAVIVTASEKSSVMEGRKIIGEVNKDTVIHQEVQEAVENAAEYIVSFRSENTARYDSYLSPVYYDPQGERYDILANILEVKRVVNPISEQEVYVMYVNCFYHNIYIAVNVKDVCGDPAVGRRIKGVMWYSSTMLVKEG